jgi:hypothetical protein
MLILNHRPLWKKPPKKKKYLEDFPRVFNPFAWARRSSFLALLS